MGVAELCAKLRLLVREAQLVIKWLRDYSQKPFAETTLSDRLAARYNIIVLVESLAGIAYVVARLLGHEEPQGYTDALTYLARVMGVEEHLAGMRALAGLRNLLVHRYWVIDDARIHKELCRDLDFVEEVLERLRGVLRECREEGG